MERVGFADLPLHPGKTPRWLFERMVRLSEAILEIIAIEFGEEKFLERISDPLWFQSLSCVLGFDWHSSGTSTVTCGALKEALRNMDIGMAIAGGKGKSSRSTPSQIRRIGDLFSLPDGKIEQLIYSSKMTAKVDSSAIQDNHHLYHHVIIFTDKGSWAVVQQGMNAELGYARRYHWYHKRIENFVEEPHEAIVGERTEAVLDMTSRRSEDCRGTSLDLAKESPKHLLNLFKSLRAPGQATLDGWTEKDVRVLRMPKRINWQAIRKIYEFQPTNYEEMLSLRGVGPSTVRALALISNLIFGDEPSWEDPVKYSFTVGGKDGVPYPVDKKVMDESIYILKSGITEAKLGKEEKMRALRRLRRFIPNV